MTDQQRRVADLVADGWQDKQIAAQLGVSTQRVRQIITEIANAWQLNRARNVRVQIARRVACPIRTAS